MAGRDMNTGIQTQLVCALRRRPRVPIVQECGDTGLVCEREGQGSGEGSEWGSGERGKWWGQAGKCAFEEVRVTATSFGQVHTGCAVA